MTKRKDRQFRARKEREERLNKERNLTKKIRPITPGQHILAEALYDTDLTYVAVSGPSGTGKTIWASYFAVDQFLKGKYSKIIILRSVTPVSGEDIGSVPGNANQKLAGIMIPFFENMKKFMPNIDTHLMRQDIEMIPLAWIRGRSLEDAIVLLDEAQNISTELFRTILTRISDTSKLIISGDFKQNDKHRGSTDFEKVCIKLDESDFFEWVQLHDEDIVRSKNISTINRAIDEIQGY